MLPLIISLAACGGQLSFADVHLPRDDVFDEGTPTAEALARYDDARAYAELLGGLDMLVIEGTEVVYSWTRAGYDRDASHHLFSGTKSFACAAARLLEADGRLDLDAPVRAHLPALAAGEDVTARHLLQFTSGISQSWWRLTWDGLRSRQRVDDKYGLAVSLDAQWPAGERFEYGSSHLMVFGALVDALGEEDVLSLLEARVFAPIGMRVGGWHHDPQGQPMLPYGAWTTAWEWAKYGVLIRDDGLWRGERVLPEGTRAACTEGSEANPAYGLTWWLNQPLGDDLSMGGIEVFTTDEPILHAEGYPDAFMAAGAQTQRLYVVPSLDLVVVLISDGLAGWDERAFFSRLVP